VSDQPPAKSDPTHREERPLCPLLEEQLPRQPRAHVDRVGELARESSSAVFIEELSRLSAHSELES